MVEHTPGDWKATRINGGVTIGCAGERIAWISDIHGNHSRQDANASLIAKAWLIPELVKALEKALGPFNEATRNPSGNPVGEPSWCAEGRDALARVNEVTP